MNERLKDAGWRLWIFCINADLYWEEDHISAECAVFDFIPYDKVDLVVYMDEKVKSRRVGEHVTCAAREAGTPVIVVDGAYEGCSDLRFNFAAGFEDLVRHVLDTHPVRNPHFMAGIEGNPFSDEREAVFKKVIEEKGFRFDKSRVSYGQFWANPAREAVQKLIDEQCVPDCIICANDIMAINVCDILRENGYNVPKDVIVTGFDGYDEVFLTHPQITTVDCSNAEMAVACADKILSGDHAIENLRIRPRLIVTESCGCPRCAEERRSTINRFNDSFYRYQDDVRMMHETITGMLTVSTPEEVVSQMHQKFTSSMSIIINRVCFMSDRNFFTEKEEEHAQYGLLYDSEREKNSLTDFDPKNLLPQLMQRMEKGYPLIIQALDYMNRAMGYIAYFYETYDITRYAGTAGITEMVSMGIGGYSNVKYQGYLLERMEEMYRFDALTGLYNRLAFQEEFERRRFSLDRQNIPLLLIMADLDHLKQVNDEHGHNAGDAAIAAVAHALSDACGEEALCVRFGGDEMIAFITGEADETAILDKIDKELEQKSRELGYTVSASCGVYRAILNQNSDIKEMVRRVDEEMYRIKKSRRAQT
ncbi:MAG: GGDEF domain-containing protein [Lachnospiraceae bacterium]|nr:GGDEF domain-containing protein [Lachnospiraceae bacterium]